MLNVYLTFGWQAVKKILLLYISRTLFCFNDSQKLTAGFPGMFAVRNQGQVVSRNWRQVCFLHSNCAKNKLFSV